MHKLKVLSYVLFGDLTQDYNLGYSLSESSEELLQRGKEGFKLSSFYWKNKSKTVVEYIKITSNNN